MGQPEPTSFYPPRRHSTRHGAGGDDAIKLDDLATPDDNTDLNANSAHHGLMPKLSGGSNSFLNGDGSFAAPSIVVSDEFTSEYVSTLVFSNSNGVTFGLDAGTITASVDAAGVNFSAGTSSATMTAITFSNSNNVSFGLNGSTLTASAVIRFSAGAASATLSALTFSNSNGVSFGLNGSTVTASVATSLTNIRVSAGTTSNLLSAITFSNSNNVSFGLNGSTLTATVTVATSLSNIRVSAGTTSNLLSALTFADSNNVSFGINASTVTASIATSLSNIRVSAGTTSNLLSAITFADGNGVSFGINASTITGSVSQSNQQLTLYATGNTTQSSTGTSNASSLIFNGAGNVSVAITNGSILISGGTAAAAPVLVSAGTTSDNLTQIVFSNSNGVSFGLNGSTITASVNNPVSEFVATPYGTPLSSAQANTLVSFRRVFIPEAVTFTRLDVPVRFTLANVANGNTANVVFTSACVIYTRDQSTLNPIVGVQGNTTYTWASNSSNFSNLIGGRYLSFGIATMLTPGMYWVGVHLSTTNNSSIGTATTQLGNTLSMLLGEAFTVLNFAEFGISTTASTEGLDRMQGICSVSISATNQTYQQTHISVSGTQGRAGNLYLIFRN